MVLGRFTIVLRRSTMVLGMSTMVLGRSTMMLGSSEQRGIGHRLCPGGRDPAPESASAAHMRGRGPGTRKGPGREQ